MEPVGFNCHKEKIPCRLFHHHHHLPALIPLCMESAQNKLYIYFPLSADISYIYYLQILCRLRNKLVVVLLRRKSHGRLIILSPQLEHCPKVTVRYLDTIVCTPLIHTARSVSSDWSTFLFYN